MSAGKRSIWQSTPTFAILNSRRTSAELERLQSHLALRVDLTRP